MFFLFQVVGLLFPRRDWVDWAIKPQHKQNSPAAKRMEDSRNCLCVSIYQSVHPSVTLSCPLHISWTQAYRLKVKITGQGHRFEPWISCPLHISYTPGRIFFKLWSYVCFSESMLHISCTSGRIFFKLWSNVHLSETMCRINNSTMPTQGQGHSSRSWVWALNFVSGLYLLYPWEDFL